MIKKFVAGAVVSAFVLTALPANAADWSKKMQACAAAVQDEGLAATGEYDVKFISASARRLTIELTPAAGGDPVVAECKISRGKVKAVELKA
jgi:hypothetical protein